MARLRGGVGLALALGLLATAAGIDLGCGRSKPAVTGTGGASGAGTGGAGGTGAGGDTGALANCLDQPNKLDRAPDGKLPCELIPPGVTLPQ